jgi:hypothetical protein
MQLSWKAQGMLAWLRANYPAQPFRFEDLVSGATDGAAATRTGLAELSLAGLVRGPVTIRGMSAHVLRVEWTLVTDPSPPNPAAAASRSLELEILIAPPPEISAEMNSSGFPDAWAEWKTYRRKIRKPQAGFDELFRQQMAALRVHGPAVAVLMLRRSMMNGWTGIFEVPEKEMLKATQSKNMKGKYGGKW